LGTLGWVAMRQQDWPAAQARLAESLELRQEIGDAGGSAWCLERAAEVALARGQERKAARLYGTAAGLREAIGSVIDRPDRAEYERHRAALRDKLGAEVFEAAWREGGAMSLEQAATYAIEDEG
jgi:hypothetical protein